MATFKMRQCLECDTPFKPRQNSALFCSDGCRTVFHHRRRARGAELYDFIMHAHVKGEKPDDVVSRLLDAYLAADKAKRAGRPSYQPIQYARINVPLAFSNEGDKR